MLNKQVKDSLHIMNNDVKTNAGLFFMLLFILTLIFVASAKKDDKGFDVNTNIIVQITWPNNTPPDIDVWVKTPDDEYPVFYNRKNGASFNLLKDDLGEIADSTTLNYEIAMSRKVVPGYYHINVMYYDNHSYTKPVPVTMSVVYKKGSTTVFQEEITKTLKQKKDMLTFFNFRIEDDLYVSKSSFGDKPYKMEIF